MVKTPPANSGNIRDVALTPGLGRSPGGGHGDPLQYSCLGNPVDRGAWRATVPRITKSRTGLKQFSMYCYTSLHCFTNPIILSVDLFFLYISFIILYNFLVLFLASFRNSSTIQNSSGINRLFSFV